MRHSFPRIYSEIDIEKTLSSNDKLTRKKIENITYGSNIKVWFICPNFNCENKCIHSYDTSAHSRTNISHKTACPFCSKPAKMICACNSIMSIPLLASEWDWEKNKGLDPYLLSIHSGVKVWWKCSNHKSCNEHEWDAIINDRTKGIKGTNCPFCIIGGSSKTCICHSVYITHKNLCLFIKEENNSDVDLKKISYASNKIINFECPECKNKWSQQLRIRTGQTSSDLHCPQCTSKSNFSNIA